MKSKSKLSTIFEEDEIESIPTSDDEESTLEEEELKEVIIETEQSIV